MNPLKGPGEPGPETTSFTHDIQEWHKHMDHKKGLI